MALETEKLGVEITAKVEGADKVDSLNKTLKGTADSTDQASKAAQRYLDSLNRQVNAIGKTKTELMAMKAEQLGVAQSAAPMIEKLKAAGADSEHFGLKTAGARRELLVLAHEMSQGNWTRFGGSLMVLGERANVMSVLFSAAGLSVGALAALVGITAIAFLKGAEESKEFANAMALTGQYAGITEGQLNSLTEKMGTDLPGGAGHARDALMTLAKTGQFSGEVLKQFGRDAMIIANLTGEDVNKVAESFKHLTEDVAKGAAEMNRQMHFLTLAQYDQIKALEETGKKQEALLILGKAIEDSKRRENEELQNNLSIWERIAQATGNVWSNVKNIGRKETIEDQIAAQKKLLVEPITVTETGQAIWADKDAVKARIAVLEQQKAEKELAATRKANAEAAETEAINAKGRLEHLRLETNERERLNKELRDYRNLIVAPLKGTKDEVSESQQAIDEAAIRKKYDHTGTKAQNSADSRLLALQDEKIKLQEEIEQIEKYGKVIDKSRAAILEWDIAHGKMKDASATTLAAMRKAAAEDDKLADQKTSAETVAALQKKVDAYTAEADARKKRTETSQAAALQEELEKNKALMSADAYNKLAAAIKAASDEDLASKYAKSQQATDDRVQNELDKIKEETRLLGLSNFERQKAVMILREEADARKLIRQNPTQEEAIRAQADFHKKQIGDAMDEQHDASRSFTVGAKSALDSYAEAATNTAAQVQKVMTDSFKGAENALADFVMKGKANFHQLALSIISDLVHIAIQRSITGPLANALFGAAGGAGGGAGSSGTGFLSFLSNLWPHANGGIMTPMGSMPLNKYANGGIATTPQVALFGEGRMNEAYVPLPDGRSIPVSMKGGASAQGGHTFNTSVTVNSDGSSSISGQQQGQAFATAVQNAIRAELLAQRRDGGLLSRSPAGA